MLGVGGLAPPSAPPLIRKRATTINPTFSLVSLDNIHKATLSFSPLGRTGFCLFAQKKQQGLSFDSIEVEKEANFTEIDDDFGDDFDEEKGSDDDNDDDDFDVEDLFVPFYQMKAWLKRKPKGFGEGKVYDTSIEDKLLQEIEQSRNAQLANVNKLKNEPKELTSKSELNKELKDSEGVSSGIRVHINNLPKKKNIYRDLKSAFEGVHGIINISPVVSGNKKTRDPVCKGFGFVDFKSVEDANMFVQMYSSQSITFGKIEKRIKCEIVRSKDTDSEGSAPNGYKITSESRFTVSEDNKSDQNPDTEQSVPPLLFWEDDDYDESDEDFDDEEFDDEDIVDSFGSLTASEEENSDITKSEMKLMRGIASERLEQKTKTVKKKPAPKKKTNKTAKLNIPGSANRLKVREKAKLADVFSRYGSKEALASEQK